MRPGRRRPSRQGGPVGRLGEHFVHKVTDCAENDLDSLPSAQNVTLCTKCPALHKTSPHTTLTRADGHAPSSHRWGPRPHHPHPRDQEPRPPQTGPIPSTPGGPERRGTLPDLLLGTAWLQHFQRLDRHRPCRDPRMNVRHSLRTTSRHPAPVPTYPPRVLGPWTPVTTPSSVANGPVVATNEAPEPTETDSLVEMDGTREGMPQAPGNLI